MTFFYLFTFLATTAGHPEYLADLPNGGGENFYSDPTTGHLSETNPGARNDFGTAFAKAGKVWTTALCQADTDGDGQSNGFEMGDICCQWYVGCANETFLATDSLSYPGDKSSLSDRQVCSCTEPPLCSCCSNPSPCDPLPPSSTGTRTPSRTPTATLSLGATPPSTPSSSRTPSASPTATPTHTASATNGTSSSASPSASASASASVSALPSSAPSYENTIKTMVGVGVGGGFGLFFAAFVYYYVTTQCGGGRGGRGRGSRNEGGMAASDGLSPAADYTSLN